MAVDPRYWCLCVVSRSFSQRVHLAVPSMHWQGWHCGRCAVAASHHAQCAGALGRGIPSPNAADQWLGVCCAAAAWCQALCLNSVPQLLLQAGLNYRHGTGHGVGAALNVHEGPQSISTRYWITTPLQVIGCVCPYDGICLQQNVFLSIAVPGLRSSDVHRHGN